MKYILASLTFFATIFFFSFGHAQVPQATISWTDRSNNESNFLIFERIDKLVDGKVKNGQMKQIGKVARNKTTYVRPTVTIDASEARRCYNVRAVNSAGRSKPSNTACKTIVQGR